MTAQPYKSTPVREFLYHWFRRETVIRALKVAGVVGPILTAINQYDLLLSLDFSPRLFAKILLTFLVPYSVSSFSSARAYMDTKEPAHQPGAPDMPALESASIPPPTDSTYR
jgi:hypothetical protein